MRGGNCNTYAYIHSDGDTDRYTDAVHLGSWAEHAYGFG